MKKIKFLPNNVETECASNENIFKAAKRIEVNVPTACGGVGACGLCRIKIISGEECLNSITRAEEIHMGNVYHITKKRLACQCKFVKDGEVIVEVEK